MARAADENRRAVGQGVSRPASERCGWQVILCCRAVRRGREDSQHGQQVPFEGLPRTVSQVTKWPYEPFAPPMSGPRRHQESAMPSRCPSTLPRRSASGFLCARAREICRERRRKAWWRWSALTCSLRAVWRRRCCRVCTLRGSDSCSISSGRRFRHIWRMTKTAKLAFRSGIIMRGVVFGEGRSVVAAEGQGTRGGGRLPGRGTAGTPAFAGV